MTEKVFHNQDAGSVGSAAPGAVRLTVPQWASEHTLRAIVDLLPGLVGLFTPDGIMVDVNQSVLGLFGLSREQVIGKYFSDGPWFAHSQAIQDIWEDNFKRLRAGETVELESQSQLPDGSPVWIHGRFTPMRDASGQITHVLGFGADCTARRIAEEELRKSEERFRLLASSGTAYNVIIQDGIVRFANKSYFDTTGYSAEELLGQSFLIPVHPDYRQVVIDNAARRARGEHVPLSYEIKILTKLGEERWLSVAGEVITYEGRPAILGTGYDITRLKDAEDQLRRSQSQMNALLEAVPDATFRYRADGTLLDFRSPWPEWKLAISPNKLVGSNIRDMQASAEVIDKLIEASRYALATQKLQTVDYAIPTPAGPRYFEARIAPSRNEELVSIIRDISERKEHEENLRSFNARLEEQVFERTLQLAEAKEAAEVADRAKSAFLMRMSYELRTPLTSIIGLSELLQEEASSKQMDACLMDVKKIEESGKHLLEMINDILDLSKLDAGALPVSTQWVWVDATLQEIVELTEPWVRMNHNVLVFDVQEKGEFWADPDRFKQVLRGLISNAAKFTHGGIINLCVSRQSGENYAWLCWEVTDSGIGIPEAQRENLFKPFHHGPAAASVKSGGTGLGLAIAHQLTQLMGGELQYRPNPSGGSIFTVRLPILSRGD